MVTPSTGLSTSIDTLSLQQLVQLKEQLEKVRREFPLTFPSNLIGFAIFGQQP